MDVNAAQRKRKHFLDSARKVTLKYKKQRFVNKCHSKLDSSYGDTALHPDIPSTELDQLCKDYLDRLQVSEAEQQQMVVATSQQSDDPTGCWAQERHDRITSSHFGEVCK